MRLSIIIPALNEAESIERAIASAWLAPADEVIVADGGSQDSTTALATKSGARVIKSARGRATQQNAGAEQARGDVLLFLHADSWLAPQVRGQIEAALQNPRVVHGALRQRIDAPERIYRWLERGNATRVRLFGLPYGDQAIFVRTHAFRAVGGFPSVPLMEDVLLMQRLRTQAWPLLLEGPVHVSPRRWQRHGVFRQTLRNWSLLAALSCGVSPERFAGFYPPHRPRSDQSSLSQQSAARGRSD